MITIDLKTIIRQSLEAQDVTLEEAERAVRDYFAEHPEAYRNITRQMQSDLCWSNPESALRKTARKRRNGVHK